MKLSTSIIALIASTVVYANNTNVVLNLLNKRGLNTDYSQFNDVTEECSIAMMEYVECTKTPTISTYDEVCAKIASDKCQKFYKDPLSVLPSCKNVSVVANDLVAVMDSSVSTFKFMCQKDEAGNYCPLSELNVKNPVVIRTDELNKIKESTCQSKVCRDSSYDFYSKTTQMVKDIDDTNVFSVTNTDAALKQASELAEYLDSKECKALTSGASTLKIGSGLLISLGLLLLSLY